MTYLDFPCISLFLPLRKKIIIYDKNINNYTFYTILLAKNIITKNKKLQQFV